MALGLLTFLAPLLLAAASPASPAPSGSVSFQVIDETDPAEISEDTVIFIDGHLVAHFVLDKQHPVETATINLPAAAHYDYALCGRITVTRQDGGQDQRVVDGGATLTDVDGHMFRALAAGDFTIFYLADIKEDPPAPPKDARHTNACSLPVS
jgi:hypothetical protein